MKNSSVILSYLIIGGNIEVENTLLKIQVYKKKKGHKISKILFSRCNLFLVVVCHLQLRTNAILGKIILSTAKQTQNLTNRDIAGYT